MPYALSNIKVKKLDLVSDPANHRHITLFKSLDGDDTVKKEDILAALRDVELVKDLSDADRAQISKAFGIEVIKATDDPKVEMSTAEQILKAVEAVLNPEDGDKWADVPEPVQKAVKGLEQRLKKAEDKAATSEAHLTKIRDAQRRTVYIEKASAFKDLPGANPDDMAPILESLSEEHRATLTKVLMGSVEAIKLTKMFKEVGSGEVVEGSAQAELESRVSELRKADPKLTEAGAADRVLEEDADLGRRINDEDRESAANRARR